MLSSPHFLVVAMLQQRFVSGTTAGEDCMPGLPNGEEMHEVGRFLVIV
jgi:hypothetical protein